MVSILFRLLCKTAVVSYVFIWNFTREIEARPARIDPLAHARRLTAVFHASGSLNQYNILILTSPSTMINSAMGAISKAAPCNKTGRVDPKLSISRWILNKTEVTMSHYSSNINYRGATYASNL